MSPQNFLLFDQFCNCSQLAMWIHDVHGDLLYSNQVFAEFFGCTATPSANIKNLFSVEDRSTYDKNIEWLRLPGDKVSFYQLFYMPGHFFILQMDSVLLLYEGKSIVCTTAAKAIESKAAGTQESPLFHVLNCLAEGVIGIGSNQRIIFTNQSAQNILELTPTQLLERNLYELSCDIHLKGGFESIIEI